LPVPRTIVAGRAAFDTRSSPPRGERWQATPAPILFGVDTFFDFMVYWLTYLAPRIDRLVPGSAEQFMQFVGVVEIAAGILAAAFGITTLASEIRDLRRRGAS
jgi:hypothetical protein